MAEEPKAAEYFRTSLALCLAVAERRLLAQVNELLSVEFSKIVAKDIQELYDASLERGASESGSRSYTHTFDPVSDAALGSTGCAPVPWEPQGGEEAPGTSTSTTPLWVPSVPKVRESGPQLRHNHHHDKPPRMPGLGLRPGGSSTSSFQVRQGTGSLQFGGLPSLEHVPQEPLEVISAEELVSPTTSARTSKASKASKASEVFPLPASHQNSVAAGEFREGGCGSFATKGSSVSAPSRKSWRGGPTGLRNSQFARFSHMKGATQAVMFANRLQRGVKNKLLIRRSVRAQPSPRASVHTGLKLELLPLWITVPAPTQPMRRWLSHRTMSRNFDDGNRDRQSIHINGGLHDHSCMQRFIMRPGTPKVVLWDCLTSLAIMHDTLMIPLQAFPLPNKDMLDNIAASTTIIWFLDILLSFLRGVLYPESGLVEMRPSKIAWMYVKSWFPLDIFIVTIDCLLLWMEGSTWVEVLPLLRICRLLRLSRITKILKISERLHMFKEYFQFMLGDTLSEKRSAVARVFTLLLLLMVMSHFICCGWYGIGVIHGEPTEGQDPNETRRWVDFFDLESQSDGLVYMYATSYHWTVTQFTPASMEVFPRNSLERAYNIAVIFLGLVMFSSVVSSMTQSMMQLRSLSMVEKQQNQAIRAYIASNGVSFKLADSIMSFLKRNKGDRRHLREQDIPVFSTLPENLLMKLHYEVYSPVLALHPLFTYLRTADEHIFCMVCHRSCSERSLLHGEEVFQYGGPGTHVYFITTGSFAYFIGVQASQNTQVNKGRTVSEAALWVNWEHCGRLSGEARCSDLVQLDAGDFQRMATQALCAQKLQKYALLFVKQSAKDASVEGVTDLWPHNRAVVRELTRQAAEGDAQWSKEYVKKLMMIWASDDLVANCFHSWLYITKVQRRPRVPGLGQRCCTWFTEKVVARFPLRSEMVSDRLSIGTLERTLAQRKHTGGRRGSAGRGSVSSDLSMASETHVAEADTLDPDRDEAIVRDSRLLRHAGALDSRAPMHIPYNQRFGPTSDHITAVPGQQVLQQPRQLTAGSEVESVLPGSIDRSADYPTASDDDDSVEV